MPAPQMPPPEAVAKRAVPPFGAGVGSMLFWMGAAQIWQI
jgi:hypothetical protein